MRNAKPISDAELRAAKLSRIPGVRIAEAAARFSVAATRVSAARKRHPEATQPSLAELALAALTHNGLDTTFSLSQLEQVAAWLDYVNHDACKAEDVRRLLEELAAEGRILLEGQSGTLLKPWP